MKDEIPLRTKLSTRSILAIVSLCVFFCCVIPAPEFVLGWLVIMVQLAIYILFGWVSFLQRVASEIRFDPSGITVGAGAVVLLVVGIQYSIAKTFSVPSWKATNTIKCTTGILGIFVGTICLIALSHEFSWSQRSRTSWVRVGNTWDTLWFSKRSKEDLKQIGLGAHNYESTYNTFPIGSEFGVNGTAGHGWMTSLLPYIGEVGLYAKIKMDVPWYDFANRAAFETRVSVYESWNARKPIQGEYAVAYFAANDLLLNANRGFKIAEITDGTSNTIFAGDVKDRLRPWGDVIGWRNLGLGINKSPDGFGAQTTGGACFLLADGTVRFISENTDPKILKALATPNVNDTVGDY